jgi:hypothetical protein
VALYTGIVEGGHESSRYEILQEKSLPYSAKLKQFKSMPNFLTILWTESGSR